jgi:hypothetical protein
LSLPAYLPACLATPAGGVQVRRVKQGSAMLRLRGGTAGPSRSLFWRSSLDTGSWRLVTDRPTTDFVALH